MALKGILFDFNGTLFFDTPLHAEAFGKYCEQKGKPIFDIDTFVAKIAGRSNLGVYTDLFDPHATAEDVQTFIDEKESMYRDLCLLRQDLFHLVDGTSELLDALKEKNIPYCLATGSGRENVDFYLDKMNLDRWFSYKNIVCADDGIECKPSPDIYYAASKKLGLSTSECLIFEDGTSGLLAANRAGAGGIIAVYEPILPSPLTDEARADHVYHDLRDWQKILKNYGILE